MEKHSVVGPSYFSEYADGKAMLGNLPPGWKLVFQESEDGAIDRVFRHAGDGRLEKRDPRFLASSLPEGWIEIERDGKGMFFFQHQGHNIEVSHDPRRVLLTSISLGFHVQTILLI